MMMAPPHWSSRTMIWTWVLFPFSLIYRLLVLLRLSLISPKLLSVPVICVGNNTAGGAGKTPTVIAICHWLKEQGRTPHVISRGYKGQYVGTLCVDPEKHDVAEVGDEPLLIAHHAPCWVSRRRIHAANAAIKSGADVIVMDDGLQNPSIVKHVTILVVDGTYGFGNRLIMPAGPCREPVKTSMRKSDAVIIMGTENNATIRNYIPSTMPLFLGSYQPDASVNISDQKVHPFSGIAHPDKFFETVKEMGGNITLESRFPDHHLFTHRDIERLQREAKEHDAQLVTTEKDWVRLPENFRKEVVAIPVSLTLDKQEAFTSLLMEHLTS